MVTAGLVIRSAAVSALILDCSRECPREWSTPGTVPSSASLGSKSASETTPMTVPSRSMTGNALTRSSCSLVAISLNEAPSLTA